MKNLKMMSKKTKMIIAGALAVITLTGVTATVMYKKAEEKKAIALAEEQRIKAEEERFAEEIEAKKKQEEEERLAAEKEAEEKRLEAEELAKQAEEADKKAEEEKQQANAGNTSNNSGSTNTSKPSTGGGTTTKPTTPPSTGGNGGTTTPTPPPTNNFKPAGFDSQFTNEIYAWGNRTMNFATAENRPHLARYANAIKAYALNGTAIPAELYQPYTPTGATSKVKAVKVVTSSDTFKYVPGQQFRDYNIWDMLSGCDYVTPGMPGVEFRVKYVTAHHDGNGNIKFTAYNLALENIY